MLWAEIPVGKIYFALPQCAGMLISCNVMNALMCKSACLAFRAKRACLHAFQ